MNVFDIIGPVMVGPSSSHTAGAVRIGRIARGLLGEQPVDVVIELHGSFAETYKGHGTDKAILAGLMEMLPDDERIKSSLELAQKEGISYKFKTVVIRDAHPNTARITAVGQTGKKVVIQGASIGGGNIVINKINDMDVEFTGVYNTLVIAHKDTPGAIAAVTNLLAYYDINIANMKVFRPYKGSDAMMVIETDQEVSCELEALIGHLPKIRNAKLIKPI